MLILCKWWTTKKSLCFVSMFVSLRFIFAVTIARSSFSLSILMKIICKQFSVLFRPSLGKLLFYRWFWGKIVLCAFWLAAIPPQINMSLLSSLFRLLKKSFIVIAAENFFLPRREDETKILNLFLTTSEYVKPLKFSSCSNNTQRLGLSVCLFPRRSFRIPKQIQTLYRKPKSLKQEN